MSKLYRAIGKNTKVWEKGFYYEEAAPLDIFKKNEDKGYLIFVNPNCYGDWNMPRDMLRVEIDKNTLCDYVGEKDKNGEELFVKDLLEDDEHFVWEILPLRNGKYQIACDDLMAVEDLIPRIHVMHKIGDSIFNSDLIHPIDSSLKNTEEIRKIKAKLDAGSPFEEIANMFEDECICDNLGIKHECASENPDCFECACYIAKKIKEGEIV